jgi:uncharacterized protein YkuJ
MEEDSHHPSEIAFEENGIAVVPVHVSSHKVFRLEDVGESISLVNHIQSLIIDIREECVDKDSPVLPVDFW